MNEWARINDLGRRIGDSHPLAVLSDLEVEQLLADRATGMSLRDLARKWGLSKSGVKGIVDGRRRAQVGPRVKRGPARVPQVALQVELTRTELARFRRRGGEAWLRKLLADEGCA